jgi:hypothetical protein
MPTPPPEDGFSVIDDMRGDAPGDEHVLDHDLPNPSVDGAGGDLQRLRDEFVDGFNSRDLDAILGVVHSEVACPDIAGDGKEVLAEELSGIWDRWPGAILTRGYADGAPCAVGWLPDEDGCWSRAALVAFDCDDGLLTLVAIPDDADTLERVEAEDPTGEELEEWSDWAEWERGEETDTRARERPRPRAPRLSGAGGDARA